MITTIKNLVNSFKKTYETKGRPAKIIGGHEHLAGAGKREGGGIMGKGLQESLRSRKRRDHGKNGASHGSFCSG